MLRTLSLALLTGLVGCEVLVAPASWMWPAARGGGAHWSGAGGTSRIALTFDDGPSDYTGPILDVLEAHGAVATFFAMGRQVEAFPATVARMARAGHQIENHGYSLEAVQGWSLFYRAIPHDEIARAQRVIRDATGRLPRYFRPPGGQLGRPLLRLVREQGLETVYGGWPIPNPNDDAATQLPAAIDAIQPGAIIILHDGDDHHPDSDRPRATLELLPALLERIDERGFETVTVSELLEGA